MLGFGKHPKKPDAKRPKYIMHGTRRYEYDRSRDVYVASDGSLLDVVIWYALLSGQSNSAYSMSSDVVPAPAYSAPSYGGPSGGEAPQGGFSPAAPAYSPPSAPSFSNSSFGGSDTGGGDGGGGGGGGGD